MVEMLLNGNRFSVRSTNGWLYLWMQRAPGRLHPALLPQLSSDGAHILFEKQFTLHRSRYKTQNVNNISTKYHPRLISSQGEKYPQHICKRSCQFPLALLINFPFKFAATVNAQFIVIFENCSYHMDPVRM